MIAKPAYLSVEIVTDDPTSGKISVLQLVSVAEQTGLSNTWSQPQYLCQHACVSTLHANCCYMYLQTFILTSFKKYLSCLGPGPSSCIRHNFKQFETLSKFRA